MEYWTVERTQRLFKLWCDGLSAGQIAKLLGRVTRAAVAGKVKRMRANGWNFNLRAGLDVRPLGEDGKPILKRRPVPRIVSPSIVPSCDAPASDMGMGLSALTGRHCRFIVAGAGLGARYCGALAEGGAWCPFHRRIVYVPRVLREPSPMRTISGNYPRALELLEAADA